MKINKIFVDLPTKTFTIDLVEVNYKIFYWDLFDQCIGWHWGDILENNRIQYRQKRLA